MTAKAPAVEAIKNNPASPMRLILPPFLSLRFATRGPLLDESVIARLGARFISNLCK